MMVCTASGARQGGMHTSRATYSAVFPRWRRPWGDRPYVAQVWPGPPSRSALPVWLCHWCGATAPERRELFSRSARCLITACSAFGVRVPFMACHRANESEVKPSLLCGSWASPLCPAPLAPRAPLDFFLNLCLPPWGVSDKFPRSRPVLRLGRPKTNVERPVLRSGRPKTNVKRTVLRSGRPKTNVARPVLRSGRRETNVERPVLRLGRRETNVERPVLRSGRPSINVERPVLRSWCHKMNVERSVLRSWLQQMIVVPQDERRTPRSTFAALQDERRTPRSTFGAPQDERRTPRSTFVVPQDDPFYVRSAPR